MVGVRRRNGWGEVGGMVGVRKRNGWGEEEEWLG